MAATSGAVLSEDFEAPFVRARLEVLLLFASVLRPLVPDLSQATDAEPLPRWYEIVDILAERLASQLPKLTQIAEIWLIFQQFVCDLSIASLQPLSAGVIRNMEQELDKSLAAWKPDFGLDYLLAANQRAASWVAQMEVHLLGRRQAETLPVQLFIHYDPEGKQSHAASVRGRSEIRWAFQLEEYSLWGALVADRIFEHEYFCHLLPVNTYLAPEIREGYLDGVLQLRHSRLTATLSPDNALAESRWNYALHRFRDDLFGHFDEIAGEDLEKLRNLGQTPRQAGRLYWQRVSEVIDYRDGFRAAEELRVKLLRS